MSVFDGLTSNKKAGTDRMVCIIYKVELKANKGHQGFGATKDSF